MEARTPHDIRHQTKSYADNSPEGPIWQIIPSTKPGHARRKKVRAFCRPCNSGWMRSIQDEAKPILAPLILGKSVKLQSSDMEVIAKWMTMTTMAGEFDHRETVSIPESQRRNFWKTKKPIENWKIWIGRYGGNEWNTRYRHEGCKLQKPTEPPPASHNTQNTAIVLGNLFLYSVSTTADDLDKMEPNSATAPEKYKLFQIWPPLVDEIKWDEAPIIGDEAAMEIATWLSHLVENQGAGKFPETVYPDRCKSPPYLEREMTPTDQMISDWSAKFDQSHPELLLPAGSPIFPICSSTSFTSSAVEYAVISRLRKEEGTVVNLLMNPVMAARLAFQLLDILNQEGYFRVGLDIIHPTKDQVLTSLRPTNWTKKSEEQSS